MTSTIESAPADRAATPAVPPAAVASVSLGDFARDRDAFAEALGSSFERYGFAVIADHGIPSDLIARAEAAARTLFALPEDVKRAYHAPGTGGARGYTPFGIETAKGATAIDLKVRSSGNNSCWKSSANGWDAYLTSDCVWMQMWVQLDSPQKLAAYKEFLDNYVNEQKKLGRFPRPLNNRLLDVNEWMRDQKVVTRDMEVQTGLAFAFLAVCLVNTIGLLLAKFTRKSGEIGLRRALGASRREVFTQLLVESGVVGLTGGVIGLVLTGFGLLAVRALYAQYKTVAHLDWTMVLMTIALAVVAALLAGLYPTWRACRVQPAAQLKV